MLMCCSAIRFYATLSVGLERGSEAGTQSTTAAFRTAPQTLCSMDDEIDFVKMLRDVNSQLDRFTNQGSGWNLTRVTDFILHISSYRPLSGLILHKIVGIHC